MASDEERQRQARVFQASMLLLLAVVFCFTIANIWNISGIVAIIAYSIRVLWRNGRRRMIPPATQS